MKKRSFYFTVVLFLVFAFTLIGNEVSATSGTTSSGYNTPVIRTAFNFTAKLNASGDVDMSWTPYATTGFNYYKIIRSTTKSDPYYPEDGYITYSSDQNFSSYTDRDVPAGTSYYRICSIAQPNRYCSPVIGITASAVSNANTNSTIPVTLTLFAQEVEGKVRLAWSGTGTILHGVKIVKSITHENPTYPVMSGDSYYYISDNAVKNYTDSAVEAGKKYYYRVCQYNGNGSCISYSNKVSLTVSSSSETHNETPVTLSLTAQEVSGRVILSWSGSGTVLHGFKIVKSIIHENPTYPVMSGDTYTYLSDSNVRGYEDSEVAPGKKYYYRICQYNGSGTCVSYSNNVALTLSGDLEDTPFSDISQTLYAGAIGYVQDRGIVEGYADGTYRPSNYINRAEFLTILVRAKYGEDISNNCLNSLEENPFTDVPKNAWFAEYVCVGKMKNIISGYNDGTFKPGNYINFAEAAKIIVNVFVLEITKEGDAWYAPYVYALQDKNFIPGTVATLDVYVKRSEMAEIIWRVAENERMQNSRDLLE